VTEPDDMVASRSNILQRSLPALASMGHTKVGVLKQRRSCKHNDTLSLGGGTKVSVGSTTSQCVASGVRVLERQHHGTTAGSPLGGISIWETCN
jgi:hypothetical protein